MAKMKYYSLYGVDKHKIYGVAYSPDGTDSLIIPTSGHRVENWQTLDFTIKKDEFSEIGEFSDYQPNDLACHLYSLKLKEVLEKSKSEYDELQWLPATVTNLKGEKRKYAILHFPVGYDVLDKEQTLYHEDRRYGPIRPVISHKLAVTHNIFTYPDTAVIFFISEMVRKNITAFKCEGITFERRPSTE
jgi:hypothetical protein